ncbi:hypothetical protein J2754_002910 [Halarchaeum solikamskense]|jgi:hypothetical protein|uniref:Halobacterial output domain-containing protein n=1 Tax=Halosegnis longus TaxID=2216012 RepID=A0AAJ4R6K0_9EURY|nr:HalOD1 output domain-containing protein [Halarchaeum solikamskense]MBP2252564.1 hypothetical protein [Halarchaeum solikamskense]RNJ22674.1 hypothetical protein Nmn1133_13680 [Salella cibi]
MASPPVDSPATSSELLVDIIEALEACGLDNDAFQLHDYIDIDALDQLVNSSQEDVEVRFTVEGIRLAVTPDSVNVLLAKTEESAQQ